jgi:hypothetical protein
LATEIGIGSRCELLPAVDASCTGLLARQRWIGMNIKSRKEKGKVLLAPWESPEIAANCRWLPLCEISHKMSSNFIAINNIN